MVISLEVMITVFLFYEWPSDPIEKLIRQIPQVLLVTLIFAICIYILSLPFMILAFATPFFRERFYAYFHLKSMPISSPSGTESEHLDKQNTGMETPRNNDIEQTE